MSSNSHESFFFSDSLIGVLDEDTLTHTSHSEDETEKNVSHIDGKFVSLSIKDSFIVLEVSRKVAKYLLLNSDRKHVFSFMDEDWHISSSDMMIKQIENERFEVTLTIS